MKIVKVMVVAALAAGCGEATFSAHLRDNNVEDIKRAMQASAPPQKGGGHMAFLAAATRPLAAAASFYGGGIAPEQPRFFAPLGERLAEVRGALLLVYGADDEGIAPGEHARIAQTLSAHKKRYTLSVYPGAPHGFASRDRESYRPVQAEAAWAQALALFDATLR